MLTHNITLKKKDCKTNKLNLNFLQIFLSFILVYILLCLLLFPQKYIQSMLNGILLWGKTVLPALLPFFIISSMLSSLGILTNISMAILKPITKIYKVPKVSGYIFFMSIFSGYPIGAKLISEFYKNNLITNNNVNSLTTFCLSPGPIFILGTVGSIMFKNRIVGIIILFSNILACLINGLIYVKFLNKKNNNTISIAHNDYKKPEKTINFAKIINETVFSSIKSILSVGVFISFFYMFIDILSETKITTIVYNFVNLILNELSIKDSGTLAQGIAFGLLEITRGCLTLSTSSNMIASTIITSTIIAFGGLCILFQNILFLSETKIKMWFLILSKTTQSIICLFITLILSILLI